MEKAGAALNLSAWALQAQIAQEVAPKVAQLRTAYEEGFRGLDNRQQRAIDKAVVADLNN